MTVDRAAVAADISPQSDATAARAERVSREAPHSPSVGALTGSKVSTSSGFGPPGRGHGACLLELPQFV